MVTKIFDKLENKYGDDFGWYRVSSEMDSFVSEAYREIKQDHPLFGLKLSCLAKCEGNDDVLYLTEYGQFVVIHLTYSENNIPGYPRYKLLDTHQELNEYLEQDVMSKF